MSGFYPDHQLPLPPVPDLSNQVERTTEIIGRGGYGTVYKGKWVGAATTTTPATIAIKTIDLVPLRDEAQLKRRFKQITRELSLWCKIQHKNILPLLGIARINDDANIPAFVCPWMENGNAREFRSRNPHFPPLLILYDIINGLQYLHTFEPEIVHGDIKAVNVLINNRCEACLCDFGLSRFLTDNTLWKTTATHAGGTARWMSPELMSGDASIPTKESDVYAYAMTCYEILSGDVPFKSISNDMVILYKVTKGQRPDRTESFHSDFIWDIITRCWEQEPNDRPSTEEVLELIRPKVDSLVESLSCRIIRRSPSPQPPAVVQQPPPPSPPSPGPQPQMRGVKLTTSDDKLVLFYVKALYDYKATIPEEFDFKVGDIIGVTATPEDGWWSGELVDVARRQNGRCVFPSNYVCLV